MSAKKPSKPQHDEPRAGVLIDIEGCGTRLRGRFSLALARKLVKFQLRCIEDAARLQKQPDYEI